MTVATITPTPGMSACRPSRCRQRTAARQTSAAARRDDALVIVYPWTGRPGVPIRRTGTDIPGAHGSTPELEGFRDLSADFAALELAAFRPEPPDHGLSARAGRAAWLAVSDPERRGRALRRRAPSPSLHHRREIYLKRLTLLVIVDGTYRDGLLPGADPAAHAARSLARLRTGGRAAPKARRPRRPRPNSRAGRAPLRDSRARSGMPRRYSSVRLVRSARAVSSASSSSSGPNEPLPIQASATRLACSSSLRSRMKPMSSSWVASSRERFEDRLGVMIGGCAVVPGGDLGGDFARLDDHEADFGRRNFQPRHGVLPGWSLARPQTMHDLPGGCKQARSFRSRLGNLPQSRQRPPRTSAWSAGRYSCSGASNDSCRTARGRPEGRAAPRGRRDSRAASTRSASSVASCAMRPSARMTREFGSASMRAARNCRQRAISLGPRLVRRRHAAHGIGDHAIDKLSASRRAWIVPPARQPDLQQRAVEQLAGIVAEEGPAGAVGALQSGREPDDEQPRVIGCRRRAPRR